MPGSRLALAVGGTSDRLDIYATKVTEALDLAIIAPGRLRLRDPHPAPPRTRLPHRDVAAGAGDDAPLIGMQTVMQLRAGIVLQPGEIIGPVSGFVVLALLAMWVTAGILRPLDRGPSNASRASARSPR